MASAGSPGQAPVPGRAAMVDWERFYNQLRQPDFIPGYEILERLGGGAFGEVYRARKRSIGKDYAVKFLRLDEAGPAQAGAPSVDRELEYASHFAAIDHPNLVTIEDLGQAAGIPYLLMGYAGEETLASRLAQGPLPPDEALRLFVQICRGTLALHDRSLAHFDLKPGNVFLKGEVARVGDYGLAKLLTEGRQTLSFGRGTPRYMAPEILRGRANHRADIYSLGVLLYECVAGKPPFESESGIGMPMRDDDTPPEFDPTFPPDLRRVVERCLRLDPEERYANLADVLTDLGQAARPGDSVTLAPIGGDSVRPMGSLAGGPASSPSGGDVLAVAGLSDPDAQAQPGRETGADQSPLQGTDSKSGPVRTAAWSDRDLKSDAPPAAAAAQNVAPEAFESTRVQRARVVPVPPPADSGPISVLFGLAAVAFDLARWILIQSVLGGLRLLRNGRVMLVLLLVYAVSLALLVALS